MYETLIVDGVDLSDVVTCVTDLNGMYATPSGRGDNLVFPGVHGETWVQKPFATNQLDLGLTLAGATTADFNQAYRTLRRVILPGKQLSLVRHVSYPGGNEQHEAIGEYAGGLAPTLSLMRFGRMTVSFKILTGLWYSTSYYDQYLTASTPTVTNVGDVLTHNMVLSLSGPGTLTNATTDSTVTYSGTQIGLHKIRIDVPNMKATINNTNEDVTKDLTWNRTFPMELAPGVNTFSETGLWILGGTRVYHKAAYL